MKIVPFSWPLPLPRLNFIPLYLTPWPLPPKATASLLLLSTHLPWRVLPQAVTLLGRLAYLWVHCSCVQHSPLFGLLGNFCFGAWSTSSSLLSPSCPRGCFGAYLKVYLTKVFLTTVCAEFLPFLTCAVLAVSPVTAGTGWNRLCLAGTGCVWLCLAGTGCVRLRQPQLWLSHALPRAVRSGWNQLRPAGAAPASPHGAAAAAGAWHPHPYSECFFPWNV